MNLGEIIYKKLTGAISEHEDAILKEWLQLSEENNLLFSRLQAMKEAGLDLSVIANLEANAAWEKVISKLKVKNRAKKERKYLGTLLKYAALFLGLFGLSLGIWTYTQGGYINKSSLVIPNDAVTLELDNGEIEVLSNAGSQKILVNQDKILNTTKGENVLDYTQISTVDKLVYNTIHVPNGKRFKIVLSDNTVVQLNSGSTLKYPIQFLPNLQRNVFLSGEAFFEVEKDKLHPFVVESGDMKVRVLGTKFNITAYEDDLNINTVLVEGSVSLYGINDDYNSNTSTLLTPGYMASWSDNNKRPHLEIVDTEIYTSWLEGKLVFRKMPFNEIIKKLQRQFNVRIENSYKELDNQVFTATFDYETIREILNSFSEETTFNYNIEGDHITIFKIKK